MLHLSHGKQTYCEHELILCLQITKLKCSFFSGTRPRERAAAEAAATSGRPRKAAAAQTGKKPGHRPDGRRRLQRRILRLKTHFSSQPVFTRMMFSTDAIFPGFRQNVRLFHDVCEIKF